MLSLSLITKIIYFPAVRAIIRTEFIWLFSYVNYIIIKTSAGHIFRGSDIIEAAWPLALSRESTRAVIISLTAGIRNSPQFLCN